MSRFQSPREYLEEARSTDTSPERLDILAETEWEFVRAAVASNPNTSPRTLAGLTPSGIRPLDDAIAIAIARRADASPESLRKLAARFVEATKRMGRTSFELGFALASNPSANMEVIDMLIDPARTTSHFRARLLSETNRRDVIDRLRRDVSEKVSRRAERVWETIEQASND